MKKVIALVLLLSGCSSDNFYNEDYPHHLEVAYSFLGYTERQNTKELKAFIGINPRYTEWCAAFLNSVLEASGYHSAETLNYPYPLAARSYLSYGDPLLESEARPGDILIFKRGNSSWKGHVGFYVGEEKIRGRKYYRVLGGNQSNEVNISLYPEHKLLGIRRINKYIN